MKQCQQLFLPLKNNEIQFKCKDQSGYITSNQKIMKYSWRSGKTLYGRQKSFTTFFGQMSYRSTIT